MKTRKYIAIITGVLGLFTAVAIALFNIDGPGTHKTAHSLADPSEEFLNRDTHSEISVERLIDDYREWARYPPNSRPLLPEHSDVIDFRRIDVPPQRMPRKDGEKFRDSGFSCQLQPQRHSLTEGESMLVFLSCMKTGRPEREVIRIQNVRLEGSAGQRKFTLPEAAFSDGGKNGDEAAGDGIYTLQFSPRASDWADVYVTVNFLIESDPSTFLHSMAAHFFSSPVAPARFTGQMRERLVDGSLVISVELNVEKPGTYTIEGNLMKEDVPLAYAREDARLPAGKAWVDLLYYGKVLRDREQPGPFRLTGLRGSLNTDVIQPEILSRPPREVEAFLKNVQSNQPNRMLIPYASAQYETARYTLAEFTNQEYDSPEKQKRVEDLMALK